MLATFRTPTPNSSRITESPGNVYLAITLTELNAESGILNFYPHDSDRAKAEVLEPGDGIICRGEDVNPYGGGEGGVIFMIRYQVKD